MQAEGPWGSISCWGAVWLYFQEVVRLHGAICPPLWSRSLGLPYRCLEPLEQVQLRAFCSYFGVPRSHPRTSLLSEMKVLSVGWEARIRCIAIGVWHRIPTDQRYHQRLIQRLAYLAFMAMRRSQWVGS